MYVCMSMDGKWIFVPLYRQGSAEYDKKIIPFDN